MKKIGLLALITIFGLSGLGFTKNNTASSEINDPKIVTKKNAFTGETLLPAFEIKSDDVDYNEFNGVETNLFVLANNIIEDNNDINYENLDLSFDINGIDLEDVTFKDDKDCLKLIKTEVKDDYYLATFKATSKPKDNYTVLHLGVKDNENIRLDINVHFVDAYYNIQDKYIIKPLKINNKNHEIKVTLTDGAEISGIKFNSELDLKVVNNKNENDEEIISQPYFNLNLNNFEYTFKTKNLGTAVFDIEYSKELHSNYHPVIRSSSITLKIVETSDYYFFEFDDSNENLVQIDTSKPKVLEPNEIYTFYVGNNSKDFDPRDYELKENSNTSAFEALELRNDISFGLPFLKIVLITGGEARKANLNIGFTGDKKTYKTISFEINAPKYKIFVNEELLNSPYYINDAVDLASIDHLIHVFENGVEKEVILEFSRIKKILGKQRIYVSLAPIQKTIPIDIEMSMNPKLIGEANALSTSSQITHFRIFLERLAYDLPVEYESAIEGYNYLKEEYKFLSEQAKQTLIDDYNFIKVYRKYIIQNNFQESFFEGIIVNVDNSRYIVPSVVVVTFLAILGVVMGISLHTIYNKKEDKDNEKRS